MARSTWAALGLLLLAAAVAEARYTPAERSLLQDTVDIDTCKAKTHAQCTGCRYMRVNGVTQAVCTACDATAGYKVSADGRTCECQPGYYYSDVGNKVCSACGANFWCAGGTVDRVACAANLATLNGLDVAQREDQCYTTAGYGIAADGTVAQCAADSYNEGGNRRPCTPCGRGLKTDTNPGHSTPRDCMAPAGYYFDRNSAKPCPRGTYTTALNTATSCTACSAGMTTAGPASTAASDCTFAKPGYHLTAAGATTAAACEMHTYQDQYSNNATTCTSCGTNLETRAGGARSAAACVAPPGYGYVAAVGQTPASAAPCADATYKMGYNRKACVPCGDSGFGTSAGNKTSFSNCYIPAGFGTVRTGTAFNAWAAAACPAGTYGASSDTYGVRNLPCTPCPKGMTTAAGGMTGPADCQTLPGWGYDSASQTAQLCPAGSWAAGGDRAECTACGTGWTTAAEGSTSSADCVIAPGYGYSASTPATPETCAFGWYSGGMTNTTACTACDATTWTTKEQATSISDCSVCRAGYGTLSGNACTYCAANSYSLGDATACTTCSNNQQSPLGSVAIGACVAQWTELEASLDVIAFAETGDAAVELVASADTAADCRTACGANCMYFAFKGTAASGSRCYLVKDNAADGASFVAMQNADTYYTVYKFTANRTLGDAIAVADAGLEASRAAAGSAADAEAQLHACTKVCDALPNCVASVLDTTAAAAAKCQLKAARMSEDYFSATHDGCEMQAQGAKMNLVPGVTTVPWSAPVYTAGV